MRIRVDAGLEAGRNRCQFLLTVPICLAVGSLYGVELSKTYEFDPFTGIFVGATGLTLFVYIQLLLEPVVVHRFTDDTGRFDELIAFLWDAAIGTVVGLPLFWYLGVDPLPALASAAAAGFLYGYVAGWVVCGGAAGTFLGIVTGSVSGKARASDMSHIQALEARGEYEVAVLEYEAVLAAKPENLTAATRLARILAEQMDRPEDGVEVIRKALAGGGIPAKRWAYALRILTEICTARLGDERLAIPDLERLVALHAGEPDAHWAARRIASMEDVPDEE